jgi:hypothetical protein
LGHEQTAQEKEHRHRDPAASAGEWQKGVFISITVTDYDQQGGNEADELKVIVTPVGEALIDRLTLPKPFSRAR